MNLHKSTSAFAKVWNWFFPKCFICGKRFAYGEVAVFYKGTPRHHACEQPDSNYKSPRFTIWFPNQRDEKAFWKGLKHCSFFMSKDQKQPPLSESEQKELEDMVKEITGIASRVGDIVDAFNKGRESLAKARNSPECPLP